MTWPSPTIRIKHVYWWTTKRTMEAIWNAPKQMYVDKWIHLNFCTKIYHFFLYFNRVFLNRIPIQMIIAYRKQITFVRVVADTFHRALSTVERANNALQNLTIIVFGWIVVSVNRITNYFCWAVSWPCLLCCSVLIYQWLLFAIHSLFSGFLALVFCCRTIAVMYLINMSEYFHLNSQPHHGQAEKMI